MVLIPPLSKEWLLPLESPPAERQRGQTAENMRERAETLERLRPEGGFDPFTGEYVVSDRQQRIDDAFDEEFMREAFTDEERAAERPEPSGLDAMDEAAALDAALGRLVTCS